MRTLEVADLFWNRGRDIMNTVRRLPWVYDGMTPKRLFTAMHAAAAFAAKRETSSKYPLILKVDISPFCNLRCTVCVHAEPGDNPALQRQQFSPDQRMSVASFRGLIDEISGHTSAVSLYYLGDPLVHPDLDAMCRIARDGGVNVHISSNFSFALNDERLAGLLTSGITHLTVCVDGITHETYARTRVGGRIERVLSNLERLTALRAKLNLRLPRIEVQYLRFRHNEGELPTAKKYFEGIGVDQVTVQWGDVHNYTNVDVGAFRVFEPRPEGNLPLCVWPYISMVVRYDGEVIPCCEHRLSEQYALGGESRALGNVFRDGVATVWASNAYRVARRMARAPGRSEANGESKGHFCEGCNVIYRTNRGELWRSGRDHEAPPLRPSPRRLPIHAQAE